MHKSVILLSVIMVLIAAAILMWSIKNQRPPTKTLATATPVKTSLPTQSQANVVSPPSPATTVRSNSDSKSALLQVNVTDTSILERKSNDWMDARGCGPIKGAEDVGLTLGTLKQKALNNDLSAATELGMHLIFDPAQDGRDEAKQVLWKASIQGSTCALIWYYYLWQKYSTAQRVVQFDKRDNKPFVQYKVHVPPTDAGKRHAILDAYAWDLVAEMRTGTAHSEYSTDLERRFGYQFQPTAAEYGYACDRATDLYNQLQSSRDAAGYGPFDNSPPPVLFESPKTDGVGRHCTHWPVPKPQCQKAEFHTIERSGVIEAVQAWICSPHKPDFQANKE